MKCETKGELCFRELDNDSENPRYTYVALKLRLGTTHELRSRQLPTNEYRASLVGETWLTREYQVDSSSQKVGLSESGLLSGP
jgi:hypothetical protein